MSIALLAKAFLDRIKADTGAGGLYVGSTLTIITGATLYLGTPGALAYPYLVYSIDWKKNDSFTSVGATCAINVSVYDVATSGVANLTAIEARLIGDASLQATGRPTYGFHKHLFVLDTGATNPLSFVGGDVVCESGGISPDTENVIRMDMSFTTDIQAPQA